MVTVKCLKDNIIKVLEHPPYLPYVAMFNLFFQLKQNLYRGSFSLEKEKEMIRRKHFANIQQYDWLPAFYLLKFHLYKYISFAKDNFFVYEVCLKSIANSEYPRVCWYSCITFD